MSWSIKLITIRGIPIRVHATFLLILLWAAYIGLANGAGNDPIRDALFMVIFVALLFLCVILHELGHSLVAQLFGVKVQDITLWPVGGMARIANMPQKPFQEFLITAAGPLTNLLLALGLGALALIWIGPQTLADMLSDTLRTGRLNTAMDAQTLLLLLAANNVILAVFNLAPAFPMDGGRLLRSLLAAVMPFTTATRVASWIGQGAALAMAVFAAFTGSLSLGLVAVFVFVAAWEERRQTRLTTDLGGLVVRQAMQPLGPRLHPLQTLGQAATQTLTAPQTAYLVVDAGKLIGIITRGELLAALRRAGPEARLSQTVPPRFAVLGADDALVDAQGRLQEQYVAVVVEEGRAVGLLSRADIARLAEVLDAHPGLLSKG